MTLFSKTLLFALASGAAALGTPASASTLISTACVSVTDSAGCLFSGNINGNPNPSNVNGYIHAQNEYNAVLSPAISLSFITKSDDANFGTFGSITGGGSSSGTWSLPGYLANFVAVKASNSFVLYQITPASSGSWDTLDIPFRQNPHDLSHLAFFGSIAPVVPEPSTWAMMIFGLGLVGGAMRRRRMQMQPA